MPFDSKSFDDPSVPNPFAAHAARKDREKKNKDNLAAFKGALQAKESETVEINKIAQILHQEEVEMIRSKNPAFISTPLLDLDANQSARIIGMACQMHAVYLKVKEILEKKE